MLVHMLVHTHMHMHTCHMCMHMYVCTCAYVCIFRRRIFWQGALIAVNIFLAFRGVQIWQLIQKVKVIEILHRVGWLDPLTRRGAGVIRGLTMPMRSALRGLNAPGRAVGKALAERKADDLALEMLRLSRARTWRPLSAPITTAWRRGQLSRSGLPATELAPPPPPPRSLRHRHSCASRLSPRTTTALASSALAAVLAFTTQGHRKGRRPDPNHHRRGLVCSVNGGDRGCQGF